MNPYPPISDYALLSDCHTAALVSRDGSIDWCCFHRFEARPVFARLLDWGKGGFFRIAPLTRSSRTFGSPGYVIIPGRTGTLTSMICMRLSASGPRRRYTL